VRIAYISSDHGIPVFGGKGASIHIQELINAFYTLGHEVSLLSARLGTGTEATISAEITKVRAPDKTACQIHPQSGDGGERLHKEQRYIEIGRAMEVAILEHHAKTPFDLIYERYSLWSLAGVRAARRIGIPCIVEVNAPLLVEQQRYRKLALRDAAAEIEAEIFSSADAIICVSDAVRDYVSSKAKDRSRLHLIPNGVNLAQFNPSVKPSRIDGLGDGPVIGFTGSLKPWHGIQNLLEAFRQIRETLLSPRLLIVGDGPLRSWIEGFAEGARLTDDIIITGWTDHRELPGLIKRMDVTVAPYPDIEGFYFSPLKLFEYLAVGRPIVASAVGQVAQIVTDSKDGLLSRPGDRAHLADCIFKLLYDKDLQTRIGAAAAKTAHNFSWRGNAEKVIDIAKTIAANQSTRMALHG